ncbi:hypothetical protein BV25DRAFT_1832582 [Artomyces pyxidatus]|uniref:Uncharacterized protein n=1 Tax=Artomyces pyxidatus TaxID=48021 RepID=A0ACB8SJZ7_9AGAM|nr:hypothetical protein BV25DRAFT_1832582 [Artomyces pyxidatus]
MASKTYEFASWPASEAYLSNPSIIQPVFGYLKASKGINEIYQGLQTEQPNIYVINTWDELKDHQNLIEDKENYSALGVHTARTRSENSEESIVHAIFLEDPRGAFGAPVTEIAHITPKEGVAPGAVEEVLVAILGWRSDPDVVVRGGAYGRLVEKPETFVLVLGWDTVEDHINTVTAGAPEQVVAKLKSVGLVELVHVKFKSI